MNRTSPYGTRMATAALAAVMLFGSAAPAFAQSSPADLQAQINALLAQIAALQGNASVSVTFTRDLTTGSSGADVTALQNWLIKNGFSIAAGATGYFGPQTAAAVAKYQAANGITPAAGYFGPTTRAKVNASAGTSNPTTPTNPGTGSGSASTVLKGGEANLSDYDLRREESSGSEGEEGVEIATASFDVEDGDIRIERMELVATASAGSLNTQPWKYFDRIEIKADGKTIASKDVDSRNDWSKSGSGYALTITGMKHIVREDDTAELTIVADIASSIDTADQAQSFAFAVRDRGIRAVDAEGIQQYVGRASDTVSFGFDAEENGDLSIRTNSKDPKASILVADEDKESSAYEVFAFDLRNKDDVDTLVTDLAIGVSGMTTGVSASDVIRRATLKVGRESFQGDVNDSSIEFEDMDLEIDGDDDVTATLTVTLARNATSTPIAFSLANADVEAEGVKSGDSARVSGSAESRTHTVAFAGVSLTPVSTSQSAYVPGYDASASYGTYTVKFKVTALEDTAYIASTTASAGTVGIGYDIVGSEYTGTENSFITSSARLEDGFYVVREGRTETFTLTVILDPDASGAYGIRLASVRFSDRADFANSTAYSVSDDDGDYRTELTYVIN